MRRFAALTAVVLSVPLPGCLTSREVVVLAADGSGRIELRQEHDPALLAALVVRLRALLPEPLAGLAAARASAGPGGSDPVERARPADPEWLRLEARGYPGVALEAAPDLAAPAARPAVRASAQFASLASAARAGLFLGAASSLERLPRRRWRFTLRDPWTPQGPGSPDGFGGVDLTRLSAALAAHVSGLRRELSVTFPVPVLETNGRRSPDGRTVQWTSAGDLEEPVALQATFELPEEAVWPTFRHEPDLTVLVRRCLLPPPQATPPVRVLPD